MIKTHAIVVDDDENTASALSRILVKQGFSVETANCIKDAKALYTNKKPSLMLVDVMLPDGNGVELIEELQDDEDVKFVVITGHPSIKIAIQSIRANVYDFLEKPFRMNELTELLKKVILTESRQQLSEENKLKLDKSNDNDNFDSNLVGKSFWEIEKEILQKTLELHDGDKEKTAETLGISLKTLYNRLHAYS